MLSVTETVWGSPGYTPGNCQLAAQQPWNYNGDDGHDDSQQQHQQQKQQQRPEQSSMKSEGA
jgi:hypothetical protein